METVEVYCGECGRGPQLTEVERVCDRGEWLLVGTLTCSGCACPMSLRIPCGSGPVEPHLIADLRELLQSTGCEFRLDQNDPDQSAWEIRIEGKHWGFAYIVFPGDWLRLSR